MSAPCFQYSQEQITWLSDRDPVLGAAIRTIGPIRRKVYPDPFSALLRAVIGQQISSRAQETVWKRFSSLFPALAPETVAMKSVEEIKACGISYRKAHYLAGIARAFAAQEYDSSQMAQMQDDELSALLMRLPGVGRWTTEMLLIFTFQRPNILSFGDLAIKRGMALLYGHKEITPAIFTKHRECYSPYATLAGMYLWAIASGKGPASSSPTPADSHRG